MTNTNHMLSMDKETEDIFRETQNLCRSKGTTLSKEISNYIKELHEEFTRPIQVKETTSIDDFGIRTAWDEEKWKTLKRTQKIALSRCLIERERQSHYFNANERREKSLAQDEVFLPKDIPEGPSKPKEKIIIKNESLDEGEVIQEEVITE